MGGHGLGCRGCLPAMPPETLSTQGMPLPENELRKGRICFCLRDLFCSYLAPLQVMLLSLLFEQVHLKKKGKEEQHVPAGGKLAARLCSGEEGDCRLSSDTIPSFLERGSSSLMALAWIEEGSQVSPRPLSEWGSVLLVPGEWLSSSGATAVLALVEVVQGGREAGSA